MQHTKHLWRAGLLVISMAFALLFGRHFAVPASFGDEGYYRADSRLELMAMPRVHGAPGDCTRCHEKQQAAHASGKHAKVSCEVCHAPLTDHVAADKKIADMPANPTYQLCLLCHLKLAARPAAFPQIVLQDHLVEVGAIEAGEPIPPRACVPCHENHKPDQGN